MENNNNSNYGIIAIVCGVLSWFILGIVLAPAGLIVGCIGAMKDKNKVPAIVAIVVSGIALVVMIMALIMASSTIRRF